MTVFLGVVKVGGHAWWCGSFLMDSVHGLNVHGLNVHEGQVRGPGVHVLYFLP